MEFEIMRKGHLGECAKVMMETYRQHPWNEVWPYERAYNYLDEYYEMPRFIGYCLFLNSRLIGAAFCRVKTGWVKDSLYIDEFFITPSEQRKGYGNALLDKVQRYVCKNNLMGIMLMTDRNKPAVTFYEKNGFVQKSHIAYLYGEINKK